MFSLFAASGAQAIVVNMSAVGQTSVPFNTSAVSGYYGVALVPGTRDTLAGATPKIPYVTSNPACTDPWLSSDLRLPNNGLCWHQGGAVMHSNETFAFTWDSVRRYWSTTRGYVEQFLSNVAAGSGTSLGSPYPVTGQYNDPGGRAKYASLFGGGCIDYGHAGGAACKFGSTTGATAGHDYPASGCPVSGVNEWAEDLSGVFTEAPNDTCLTDAQIRGEVSAMVTQTGIVGRTVHGYTPLIVLLTPPGVETCIDSAGTLCSANGNAAAQFCSYHSQVDVNGTEVAYLVQPWTASWTPIHADLGCDDPDIPQIPGSPSVQEIAKDAGERLVSPLSQAQIGSVVNPALNGWFALNGAEMNDNGCVPLGNSSNPLDATTINGTHYFLQREFNNAGIMESDPNALACTDWVTLTPTFVMPSSVNKGDVVQFDGSTSPSTLIVTRTGYAWDFGDGTTSIGPSVEHSYSKAGTYSVTLTVTDRGGDVGKLSQTITVLGPSGPPPPKGLNVHMQLVPQGFHAMLRGGLAALVRSNQPADGIATLMIGRHAAALAHIKHRSGAMVVIGRGTVAGITSGAVTLHLRLSRVIATKLRHLRHLKVTVRLALVSPAGGRIVLVAAGRY